MPTLKIDLSTRILKDSLKVYFVHPGARYTFYDDVLRSKILPVDVPFLEIEDKARVPDAEKIAPMLERARQIRKWAKRPQSEAAKPRPPLDLDFYRTGLQQESGAQGARTKLRNSAQKLLWTIPGGSLAVIPSRKITGYALLAEFENRKKPREVVEGRDHYNGLQFLGRPLRNIEKIPMLALPGSVVASARSTRVIETIDGHAEDQILRLFYGDYQRSSDYVAGVSAHTDNFNALVLGQMIDLHVAIEHFLNTGNVLEPGRALYESNVKDAPYLHATINSPDGRAYLESSGIATFAVKLLIIVAASGVALTTAGDLIANAQILVENSAQQNADSAMVQASADALVNFFAASGHSSPTEYLEALQNGLERNATTPMGKAEIEP